MKMLGKTFRVFKKVNATKCELNWIVIVVSFKTFNGLNATQNGQVCVDVGAERYSSSGLSFQLATPWARRKVKHTSLMASFDITKQLLRTCKSKDWSVRASCCWLVNSTVDK